MKSDKPFQKSLVCGGILLIITFCFLFAALEQQELYYLKYGRVFAASFLPAGAAAIWASSSKKNWTWLRFILVTVIFYPFCIMALFFCSRFIPETFSPVPIIYFLTKIPAAWTIEKDPPITSTNQISIGTQLSLKNKDGKRMVWVEAINSNERFDANIENWKTLIISRSMKDRFQVRQNETTQETEHGRKTTILLLSVQRGNVTNNITCKAWTDRRFFVTCEARGENVDIFHDEEISEIFSSVAVK